MDNQNEPNIFTNTTPQTTSINSPNYNVNSTNHCFPVIDTLAGWMKFIGIYTIVVGAITCLGIITAAIGVPMILSGIALTKASQNIKVYKSYNNPFILNEIFTHINKYFKTQGIFIILGIIFSVIYFAILLFVSILTINGMFQPY